MILRDWLLLLGPILQGSYIRTVVHFIVEYYCLVWLYRTSCIFTSGAGHLSQFYFWLLCMMPAVNICVQVFVWTHVFTSLGYIPRNGIDESHGNSVFQILGNCQDHFPKQLHDFTFPPMAREGSSFSTVWATLVIICLFCCCHPSGCEVGPPALSVPLFLPYF